jgi:hypothetical protein
VRANASALVTATAIAMAVARGGRRGAGRRGRRGHAGGSAFGRIFGSVRWGAAEVSPLILRAGAGRWAGLALSERSPWRGHCHDHVVRDTYFLLTCVV